MVEIIKRPYDPTRRRFYLVGSNFRLPGHDYDIRNKEELDAHAKRGWWGFGRHEFRIPWGMDEDGYANSYHGFYGLPELEIKPCIKVGMRNKLMDVYGSPDLAFVSPRAKHLLESIDPDGFEFAECETLTKGNVKIDSYWLMAVNRVIYEFDEEDSVFEEVGGDRSTFSSHNIAIGIMKLYDLRMMPNFSHDIHTFYLWKKRGEIFFDGDIVDEWRRQRLRGFFFTPLQPPSEAELKNVSQFKTFKYYLEEYRHEWQNLEKARWVPQSRTSALARGG